MIKLDLYRFLPEQHDMGFVEEPDIDCRYTAYKIFVLETRLFPLIYDMFPDTKIDIYPHGLYNKETNRMDVYLKIAKMETDEENEDDPVTLTVEQRSIIETTLNKITSENIDYVLIDIHELYNLSGKRYPFSWFRSVLEYSLNDTSYNPFVKEEGIYLKFNPFSDYKPAFHKTCKKILKKIDTYYEKGVIVLGNVVQDQYKKELIKNWDLIPLDKEEKEKRIFQPNWIDRRFADNQVDFLLQRVQGEQFVSFPLPDNLAKRHGIIRSLKNENILVESGMLKVECDNIEKAKRIASLVDYGFATTYGRVMLLVASRMSEVHLFSEYVKKNNVGEDLFYMNDSEILFSVLLNVEYENADTNILSKKMRDYSISRLIEVSKVSKFKNMSPHQIIEEEYSKL